jgi:heme/copper-type cytochrome/quinol oxidase subunit 2
MNTGALIFMLIVQGTVLGMTIYFFRKVLKAPHREEPDSYTENDDIPR